MLLQKSPAERDPILQQNLSTFIPRQDANLVLIKDSYNSHSFYYNTPLNQCRKKNRNSSKPQHLITNQEENELRENVNGFKVFKMSLELLKCKLKKLRTEMQRTETGSVLSTRLKWCTLQPRKVQAPGSHS